MCNKYSEWDNQIGRLFSPHRPDDRRLYDRCFLFGAASPALPPLIGLRPALHPPDAPIRVWADPRA